METDDTKPIQYRWDSPNRPELVALRERYELNRVVESDSNDFEKILLLKTWVFKTLPHGNNPKKDYQNATEILEDATSGEGEFYCSHSALAFIECATALGFFARKVGVDNNHEFGEEEMHHGVADIWDPVHQKWVVIDAMHNLHFEKGDTPLNALEVRDEYIRNRAKDVEGVIGNHERRIGYTGKETGFGTPSNYYWFFVYADNGPDMRHSPTLLYIDENNRGKKWYRGGRNKGEYTEHPMYQGQFVEVDNPEFIYPNLDS